MNVYVSKDFYLSGYLICKGFKMTDYDRQQGFSIFTFQNTPKLQDEIKKYYKSETVIDPLMYGQILRQLKGVMHTESVSIQNQTTNNGKICSERQ